MVIFVICCFVGIGVYFVCFGQCVVQIEGQFIIFIGVFVFNNLFGCEVYMFNFQFGGIQIMYCNGVFYMIVNDDFVGVVKIVEWLVFVFEVCNGLILFSFSRDDWDCDVVYILLQK